MIKNIFLKGWKLWMYFCTAAGTILLVWLCVLYFMTVQRENSSVIKTCNDNGGIWNKAESECVYTPDQVTG